MTTARTILHAGALAATFFLYSTVACEFTGMRRAIETLSRAAFSQQVALRGPDFADLA